MVNGFSILCKNYNTYITDDNTLNTNKLIHLNYIKNLKHFEKYGYYYISKK